MYMKIRYSIFPICASPQIEVRRISYEYVGYRFLKINFVFINATEFGKGELSV